MLGYGVVNGNLGRSLARTTLGIVVALSVNVCSPSNYLIESSSATTCTNGLKDGSETGIDCGGAACPQCVIGDGCKAVTDCTSGVCATAVCRQPHCGNLLMDQDEEGVDCGGADCTRCGSSNTCSNRKQDPDETDIDCGGSSSCERCANAGSCNIATDCVSGNCANNVCRSAISATGGAQSVNSAAGAAGFSDRGGGAATTTDAGGSGGANSGGSRGFAGAAIVSGGSVSTGGTVGASGALNGGSGSSSGGRTGGTSGGGTSGGGTSGTSALASGGASGSAGTGAAKGGMSGAGSGGIGTGGNGGAAGSSGGSAGSSNRCNHTPVPSSGLVTDFSEFAANTTWTSGTKSWGGSLPLSGTTFHYGTSGVTLTATITSGGSLKLTTTLANGQYAGFGLAFTPCSDATAFASISSSILGSLGGAVIKLQLQTSRNLPIDAQSTRGECAYTSASTMWDNCGFNTIAMSGVASTAKAFSYTFAQLTGGKPITPTDPTELVGIQWQFECGTGSNCVVDITLDDVRFVK